MLAVSADVQPRPREDSPRCVAAGDCVVLFERFDRIHNLVMEKGKVFQCRYGTFRHNDMIGRPYGTKVYDTNGAGWMYLLAPSPELWTLSVLHRTQILYTPDISLVLAYLQVVPGSVVLESGTGTGSLSTAFARAIHPTGHLYTFEYHKARADLAVADFKRNGLSDIITVRHRDACTQGFDVEPASVDAVFLDLPSPWLAVESAARALKPGGRLCSFSPCIEQVLKAKEALKRNNFTLLSTIECLQRKYDVRRVAKDVPAEIVAMNAGRAGSSLHKREMDEGEDEEAGKESKKHRVLDQNPQPEEMDEGEDPPKLLREPIKFIRPTNAVARPFPEMKGHTGFLTFASKNLSHQSDLVQGDDENGQDGDGEGRDDDNDDDNDDDDDAQSNN